MKSNSSQSLNRKNSDSLIGSVVTDRSNVNEMVSDSLIEKEPLETPSYQQTYDRWLLEGRVPREIRDILIRFDNRYAFYLDFNPFYLRGDFNGDGYFDIAILIKEVSSNKRGILIYHGKLDNAFVLGAGNYFSRERNPPDKAAFDNFDWLNIWFVYGNKDVEQGVTEPTLLKLVGEAIYAEKAEAAGGLIYWNGKGYYFYQLGD